MRDWLAALMWRLDQAYRRHTDGASRRQIYWACIFACTVWVTAGLAVLRCR